LKIPLLENPAVAALNFQSLSSFSPLALTQCMAGNWQRSEEKAIPLPECLNLSLVCSGPKA